MAVPVAAGSVVQAEVEVEGVAGTAADVAAGETVADAVRCCGPLACRAGSAGFAADRPWSFPVLEPQEALLIVRFF